MAILPPPTRSSHKKAKIKTKHHPSLQLYFSTESTAKLRCHSVVCETSNKNKETKEKNYVS